MINQQIDSNLISNVRVSGNGLIGTIFCFLSRVFEPLLNLSLELSRELERELSRDLFGDCLFLADASFSIPTIDKSKMKSKCNYFNVSLCKIKKCKYMEK